MLSGRELTGMTDYRYTPTKQPLDATGIWSRCGIYWTSRLRKRMFCPLRFNRNMTARPSGLEYLRLLGSVDRWGTEQWFTGITTVENGCRLNQGALANQSGKLPAGKEHWQIKVENSLREKYFYLYPAYCSTVVVRIGDVYENQISEFRFTSGETQMSKQWRELRPARKKIAVFHYLFF